MKYEVTCDVCKQTVWVRGSYDPSCNALELNDNDRAWDEACDHIKAGGDYTIGNEEAIDDEP